MSKFRALIEGKIKPEKHISFLDISDDRKREDDLIASHLPNVSNTSHSNAIRSYSASSKGLNRYLWENKHDANHKNSSLDDDAKTLSDILKTAPAAKEDFHVYTGINSKRNKIEKGDLHIPAFTSTSTKDFVAGDFGVKYHSLEDHPNKNGDIQPHMIHHILKIHVKKGQQVGAYIAPHSNYSDEHEFLINKNHTIHVSDDYEDHPGEGNRIFRIHHATISMGNDK